MSLDLRERDLGAPNVSEASESAIYEGLAGVRLALRKFLAFSESALRSAGVTSSQYQAMLAIKASRGGALTMKALAAELLLRPNGAVQLVDRLEGLGMVLRTTSDADRRSVLLSLTSAGESMLHRLARHHRAELMQHRELLVESLRRLEHIAQ